jgi:hypothetical protein
MQRAQRTVADHIRNVIGIKKLAREVVSSAEDRNAKIIVDLGH